MDIIFFYIWAALLTVIGGAFWIFSKKIVLWEWLVGATLAFVMAGIFHLSASIGATSDVETWSGEVVSGRHYSAWTEYYEEAIYKTERYYVTESYTYTTGSGKNRTTHHGTRRVEKTRRVFSHWAPRTKRHNDSYELSSNIQTSYYVSPQVWEDIALKFGDKKVVKGDRSTFEHNSKMIAGDPNDYVTSNKTAHIVPITKLVSFENKIRATPTAFSFPKVPQNISVYPYPENSNPFQSDRLVGTARKYIDQLTFDRLNARLGPRKKVNLIIVGFSNRDSMTAQWQEAAWLRGKKNDVVITFSHGQGGQLQWVKAFGWTDKKTCLRNLETIVLDNGVNNSTLNLIENEIVKNYTLKNWEEDFAYIRVPAPAWAVWMYFTVSVLAQIAFWFFAHNNEYEQGGRVWRYRY